jgi:hypothetical protein
MQLIRSALALFLIAGGAQAFAEQITCESHGGRAEACGTVVPGSDVRMIEQISSAPCIQGRTWSADNDSIWVSGGCRAVFDVQPRYSSNDRTSYSSNDESYYYDADRPYKERRDTRYARDDSARRYANGACVNRAVLDQPYGEDQVATTNVRRVSDDLFVVDMNTPKGPVACTVDRLGNVRSLEMDYR